MCWGNFVLFPVCWELLIMERCYILSRAFSSFLEGIILFASFILLMWCIMFIDVSMLLKFTKLLDTNMSNSPSLEHFPIVQHTCLLSYDYPDQLYLDSQAIFFSSLWETTWKLPLPTTRSAHFSVLFDTSPFKHVLYSLFSFLLLSFSLYLSLVRLSAPPFHQNCPC